MSPGFGGFPGGSPSASPYRDEQSGYPAEKTGHPGMGQSQPSQQTIPQQPQYVGQAAHTGPASASADDVGTFNGGSYRVSHRDTNSILTVQLAIGCPFTAKPGTSCSTCSISSRYTAREKQKNHCLTDEIRRNDSNVPHHDAER